MGEYHSAFLDALHNMNNPQSAHCLSFLIGTDHNARPISKDFSSLTHLVIAGATGTGKSTLAHAILLSLISQTTPEELQLILCDTKHIELSAYNGIAHLLLPVLSDPARISAVIQWTATEINRRLHFLTEKGLRSFNAYIDYMPKQDCPILPRILLVIDDAADAISDSESWNNLQRVAQCGRSVGIHLLIITQKADDKKLAPILSSSITARAVFNTFSGTEERLLLGSSKNVFLSDVGEIIFCTIPSWEKERIRCYPITDADISTVLSKVSKKPVSAEITTNTTANCPKNETLPNAYDDYELFVMAVEAVFATGQASISMLQRRLNLGYARAARIMDRLEDEGIVGHVVDSKPRSILITPEQWQQMSTNTHGRSIASFPRTAQIYRKVFLTKPKPKRWFDFIVSPFEYQETHNQTHPISFDGLSKQTIVFSSLDEFEQFLASHPQIDEIRTKVVGSTYPNDDGTSRQTAMSHCRNGETILFYPYLYQGSPAFSVFSKHGQLGHLSADVAAGIEDNYGSGVFLSGIISEVTGGNDGRHYGSNLIIRIFKL